MNALHHLDIPVINPITLSESIAGLTEFCKRFDEERAEKIAKRDEIIAKSKANTNKKKYQTRNDYRELILSKLCNGELLSTTEIGNKIGVGRCCSYNRMIKLELSGLVQRVGEGFDTKWRMK